MTSINRVSTDDFGNVEGIEELLYTSDSIEYEDITALERVGLDTVTDEIIQNGYQPFNASTMIRYDAELKDSEQYMLDMELGYRTGTISDFEDEDFDYSEWLDAEN